MVINKWDPLLCTSHEQKRVRNALRGISENLSHASTHRATGLLDGKAGVGIFWEYYYAITKDLNHRQLSVKAIDSALVEIRESPMGYSFCRGVSGILWAYLHLRGINETITKLVIPNSINEFLLNCCVFDLRRGKYDYLHSGIGPALYFLRLKNDSTKSRYIEALIKLLKETAIINNEGVSWLEKFEGKERYNLGLSHGIPSIMVVLAKIVQNQGSKEAGALLLRTVNWLLDKRVKGMDGNSFPIFLPDPEYNLYRQSWCYGDLGISIALLKSGISCGNETWINEAIKTALKLTVRRDEIGIFDSCLCHGYAGNALIYNRLYHYTRIKEFRKAAVHWYLRTLDFYEKHHHFNVCSERGEDGNIKWGFREGILEGISGVGLSLISSISEVEPSWDECLLLS